MLWRVRIVEAVSLQEYQNIQTTELSFIIHLKIEGNIFISLYRSPQNVIAAIMVPSQFESLKMC